LSEKIGKEIIERELEIAKKIGKIPNFSEIVYIYDSFSEGERYYIVMEYCERGSLFKFIKSHNQK
jgi:serine/threonine protein kinase